jgi:hypothetical protein
MYKKLRDYFGYKMDIGQAQTLAFVITAIVQVTVVTLCILAVTEFLKWIAE